MKNVNECRKNTTVMNASFFLPWHCHSFLSGLDKGVAKHSVLIQPDHSAAVWPPNKPRVEGCTERYLGLVWPNFRFENC